jgi:outer membrane immunogenic protein
MSKSFFLALSLITSLANAAAAADLHATKPGSKKLNAVPLMTWTGFYAGAQLGYALGLSQTSTSPTFATGGYFAPSSVAVIADVGNQNINPTGLTGGAHAGYNLQLGNVVYGIEGDLSYFAQKASKTTTFIYPCCTTSTFTNKSSLSTNWLGTLRPRIGYASGASLFYVTGGLAIIDQTSSFDFSDTGAGAKANGSAKSTVYGMALGLGTEYAVNQHVLVRLEYMNVTMPTKTLTSTNLTTTTPIVSYPGNVFEHKTNMTSDILRGGASYKF